MIGSQIGSYKILDKLGEGGMGIVYKAVDTSLDRIVAIKSLTAELAKNPDLEKRFRAEAKAQANLNHTNIATLYAFFVQEGTAWMVMEFIEGETFHDMIQRRGPIPSQEAVPLFKQALLGMGYAHRAGIVHRDIKPSNIMVNRAGIVKVMDFGIAKVMGNRGMTRTGTQMGTAYYMSPEQVVNRGVDMRSDIYSLGVTLYEMLTANVPFTGDTEFEVMQAHMQTPPPLPTRFYPYIPKGVENAVLKAIEKSQDARFQTVEEFGAALERPEDYQAAVASPAVAGAPLAGMTRLEAPTQTIHGAPMFPVATPPTGMRGGPPAPAPPAPSTPSAPPAVLPLGRKNMLIAGGCAVIVLAVLGFMLRPKPKPAPVPMIAQGQSTPIAPPQSQGQVEVPIPLPPGGDSQPTPGAPPAQNAPGAPPPGRPDPRRPNPPAVTPAPAPAPGQPAPPQEAPSAGVVPAAPPAAPPRAPAAPATAMGSPVTVPAGTRITVRTSGMISTRSSKEGDRVAASVAAPVMVGARTAIPRGVDATIRVVSVSQSGKIEGRAEVVIHLAGLTIGGRQYTLASEDFTAQSGSRGGKSAKVIGGMGAVGGAVGGIFHKKNRAAGAAEGAAVGAGAGVGVQLVTKGEAVMIEPETRLTFTLKQPVEVMAP